MGFSICFSVRQLVIVNRNLRSFIEFYLLWFSPICLWKSLSRARSLTWEKLISKKTHDWLSVYKMNDIWLCPKFSYIHPSSCFVEIQVFTKLSSRLMISCRLVIISTACVNSDVRETSFQNQRFKGLIIEIDQFSSFPPSSHHPVQPAPHCHNSNQRRLSVAVSLPSACNILCLFDE